MRFLWRRYFSGTYKYLRAARDGREKLHSHLVQPDSLGIALLACASSGQLCSQVWLSLAPETDCMLACIHACGASIQQAQHLAGLHCTVCRMLASQLQLNTNACRAW